MRKIEFFKHSLEQQDIDNAIEILNSLFLTTGDAVEDFEKKFSKYIGCKYTIGVNSCTAALHLSLLAYGVGPGDEVITTPMTFIATANAIIQADAMPVFVDVEPDTGNINADLIESAITPRTKAILPVHLYGQMCDMKKIKDIAHKHKLVVIEDAAHAIEAKRDNIRVGQAGDIACFSFYPTKSITSGEGGAITVNDESLAIKLKKMRNHGMSQDAAERYSGHYKHWDMEIFGWKYNMNNIQAALLLNQLDNIESFRQRREDICRMYERAFAENPQITLIKIDRGSKSASLMFTVMVQPEKRDEVLQQLQQKWIGVAVNYRAIHLLTYYRQTYGYKPGMYPVAERIGDSTITLPLYHKLTDEEVQYVIAAVNQVTNGTTSP